MARKPVSISPAERAIIDALKLYRCGDDQEEPLVQLSDMLKDTSKTVSEVGGKGEIVMKITLSGEGKNLALKVECSAKKPKRKPPQRLLYAEPNGELVTHDPDQYTFQDLLARDEVPAAEEV